MDRRHRAALAALTALCIGCLPTFVSGGPHGLRSATSRSLRSGAARRAGSEEAGRIVILGAGLQGAALAYFLTRRGVKPVVVERDKVAAAASGKGGGFLARDWGDSITRKLHTVSFKLHEELAETLGIESYRKLPVLSAAPGPRSDRTSDMCPWLDGEVADARVMDPNGAQASGIGEFDEV
ncbi:putative oxidoreductase C1F5.03c [Symbiodinium microadriaticum]|uniref:Putative oxidoreductase C1F5.03c n=1 Tax=Symbiodinium microadriaticum TaxID=2951 RepID=A0A1Q9D1J6_SYMMI|nr:putative oxidoreductase C1F5.03c [Symbiodinium microadriaticum]